MDNNAITTEKRSELREISHLLVNYRLLGEGSADTIVSDYGLIRNKSRHGVSVVTTGQVMSGERIVLRFSPLGSNGEIVTLTGTVRWTDDVDCRYCIGVQLDPNLIPSAWQAMTHSTLDS
jgi:hypothetical protein